MENKSHALLAGIFVLLLLIAAAITAIWLGRKDVTYSPCEIVSTLPVGGLSIQSQVRYQGMAVGQVQGLEIDKDQPGAIRLRIGVLPDTPLPKAHGLRSAHKASRASLTLTCVMTAKCRLE